MNLARRVIGGKRVFSESLSHRFFHIAIHLNESLKLSTLNLLLLLLLQLQLLYVMRVSDD
jgi:hypothetical protein